MEILKEITNRKSIRAFAEEAVPKAVTERLFEAARWAASSFNEQPWRFLYGHKGEGETWEKLLACANEFNAAWAGSAPLLMLVSAKTTFSQTGKPNRHAWYDTGAAMANLATQATKEGLYLHQMAGFDPAKASELFQIPSDFEAVALVAIGYQGDPVQLPANLQEKENAPRVRKPISETAFEGKWKA